MVGGVAGRAVVVQVDVLSVSTASLTVRPLSFGVDGLARGLVADRGGFCIGSRHDVARLPFARLRVNDLNRDTRFVLRERRACQTQNHQGCAKVGSVLCRDRRNVVLKRSVAKVGVMLPRRRAESLVRLTKQHKL